MKEKYEHYKLYIDTVAFLIFWALLYFICPEFGEKAANSEATKPFLTPEMIASFFVAVVCGIWVTPFIASVADSFYIFFGSPIFRKRWSKFKSLKRGYYSFVLILVLFVISFFAEFLVNGKAICVKYKGKTTFTLFAYKKARDFGMKSYGAPNYRAMKIFFEERNRERNKRISAYLQNPEANPLSDEDKEYHEKGYGDDYVMLPIYPYGSTEYLLDEIPCRPPQPPTWLASSWRDSFFEEAMYEFPKPLYVKENGEALTEDEEKFSEKVIANIGNIQKVFTPEEITRAESVKNSVVANFAKQVNVGNDEAFQLLQLDEPVRNRNLALSGCLKLKKEILKRYAKIGDDFDYSKASARDTEKILKSAIGFHILGTDDRGRDVFARMVYGFRISLAFALVTNILSYAIGISFGALLGYYGGKFDIIMQRFIEIWSAMPFLYTVMIFAAIMIPNFLMLVGILVLFDWMGMTYYIRGEFLREKSKDYVAAAKAIGCTDSTIIFKHILPNSLTPVISFAPFSVIGGISSLVSLDFLGFGLPAPTPSWGELLGQGLGNLTKPWLILSPTVAMFLTLLLVSFIGEAIREAFDPKQYSRLR